MINQTRVLFCCAFLWLSLSAFWLHTLSARSKEAQVSAKILRLRVWLTFALTEIAVAAIGHAHVAVMAMLLLGAVSCVEVGRVSGALPHAIAGFALALSCAMAPPLQIGVATAVVASIVLLLPFQLSSAGRRMVTMLLGAYIGLAPAALFACRDRPGMLMAVLLTLTTSHLIDIASGFAGKHTNSHRPLPVLSPNKTVLGFGVGALLSIPAGLALTVSLQTLKDSSMANVIGSVPGWFKGICLGMSLWAITALGDLVGSKVKRILQVKDYSASLGPHGGFMDRLDALVPAIIAGSLLAN